jgi:phosphoglycerate dehydrogenase-like enzyme
MWNSTLIQDNSMRIAVLDDYQNLSQQLTDWSAVLKQAEVTVFNRHLSEDEAATELRDFDAICMLRERMAMPRSLLDRLPNLKFIAITGVEHRTLDVAAAQARGIVISHTARRGQGTFATAELAWGLIIALARHIPEETTAMRTGGWQRTLGISLGGRTLGVVGLGRLGRHMVPIAKAFGMNVIAWSQNMTEEQARNAGTVRVDKEALFEQSDFISLHVVLSERTRNIVDRPEFALMKPTAYLVNTSRGPLINRDALVEALSKKRIGGAGLDTFDVEPLPDGDPLRGFKNVLLTPHLGYTVHDLMAPFYEDTVENLLAFMAGTPCRQLPPH